jgi:hypothetical protein
MPANGLYAAIGGSITPVGDTPQAFLMTVDPGGVVGAANYIPTTTTDQFNGVALDGAGNVYAAGTFDSGGPTQQGAVAKIDPTISTIIWFSPLAGSSSTALTANGVALTAAGDVIATGADSSGQAYLTRLDGSSGSTGGTILDYTVFGGTGGSDFGNGVAVRSSDGHVFDVGTTNSSDFPVTDGSTLNGTTDGFLTQWTIP